MRSGLHEYDFRIDQAFFQHFEGSPLQDANVNVHLLFDKHPDMYVMTFQISGTVKTTCDRCLEEFDLPIEDDQTLLVKFDEKESEDTDIIYILKGTQMLNVARYIYEFVNLAVPIVKHHEDAGESCNPEMLKYLEQEIVLEGARTSLTLGRDKGGDLVIIDRMASRQHGKIERRLDKFVLADHSANGTYVTVEGDTEVVLRRAEFALRGHGWIAFGQPRASATETVEFFCE